MINKTNNLSVYEKSQKEVKGMVSKGGRVVRKSENKKPEYNPFNDVNSIHYWL